MNKNIVIIGMPGSGKSTIGYMLSKKINMDYIDMDEYIEMDEKKSIKEMFQISEDYFRDVETRCTKSLSKLNSHIIATGGGVVKRKENIHIFKENCIIVFINRPLDNIIQDIDTNIRPLLAEGKNKLYQLYNERINLYKEYCDIEIMNNKEIPYALEQITDLISNQN